MENKGESLFARRDEALVGDENQRKKDRSSVALILYTPTTLIYSMSSPSYAGRSSTRTLHKGLRCSHSLSS